MGSLHATASGALGSLADTLGPDAARRAAAPRVRAGPPVGCRAVQPASAPRRRGVVRWGIGDFIWVWFAAIIATSLLVLAILQVVDPPPPEISVARFDRAVEAGQVSS